MKLQNGGTVSSYRFALVIKVDGRDAEIGLSKLDGLCLDSDEHGRLRFRDMIGTRVIFSGQKLISEEIHGCPIGVEMEIHLFDKGASTPRSPSAIIKCRSKIKSVEMTPFDSMNDYDMEEKIKFSVLSIKD